MAKLIPPCYNNLGYAWGKKLAGVYSVGASDFSVKTFLYYLEALEHLGAIRTEAQTARCYRPLLVLLPDGI